MNVIECQGLTKEYGKTIALNDLSFTIKENKITGLIGRNGAGKTTLLNIIAGYIHETTGDIKVFSEHPFNNLKVSAHSIFIDDHMHLPTTLNLGELLDTAKQFYTNWDEDFAYRLMEYFSLSPAHTYPSLSKGMRSTFHMIMGLAARCPLTIFDEPTTGMDAAVRKDFYRALLKDYIAYPRTIIFSSHLLNEIEDILEDVLLIKEGKKCLHVPMDQLKEYAVGLNGETEAVQQVTKDQEILYETTIGHKHSYAVVKNDSSEVIKQKAKAHGVELSPVTANDVCVYLTNKSKGGIDDVFNRG